MSREAKSSRVNKKCEGREEARQQKSSKEVRWGRGRRWWYAIWWYMREEAAAPRLFMPPLMRCAFACRCYYAKDIWYYYIKIFMRRAMILLPRFSRLSAAVAVIFFQRCWYYVLRERQLSSPFFSLLLCAFQERYYLYMHYFYYDMRCAVRFSAFTFLALLLRRFSRHAIAAPPFLICRWYYY